MSSQVQDFTTCLVDVRDIIVIGASAGGFDAIKRIVADLPSDLDASIFIVWHISPDVRGILPAVINRIGTLRAAHALDKEPIKRRRIYVAPPDHHMLIEKDQIRLSRGPKENRFRPAVDPLFRSAAFHFGKRVIGVILSGALDDGTAGLWAVKQYRGITIVQDPEDAEVPSMPENALQAVQVDYKIPVNEIGRVLTSLVDQPIGQENGESHADDARTKLEIGIAMEERPLNSVFDLGEISPFTCPDCHGVLTSLKEGGRTRFRCHTGHAFSADSLLATLTESIEQDLWSAIRSIQESVMLLNHMGDHLAETNHPRIAGLYFKKAKEAEGRLKLLRETVFSHEQLNADNIEREAQSEGNGEM